MLLATQARAALTCAKIDYAEARDWPAEVVEREYCKADQALRNSLATSADMTRAGLRGEAQRSLQDAKQCQDEQAMLGRLLDNVHHRPRPNCRG